MCNCFCICVFVFESRIRFSLQAASQAGLFLAKSVLRAPLCAAQLVLHKLQRSPRLTNATSRSKHKRAAGLSMEAIRSDNVAQNPLRYQFWWFECWSCSSFEKNDIKRQNCEEPHCGGMVSSAWPRAPDPGIPGGKTQTFTRGGAAEVRLGHSGLGLGQGHQVSRLARQRLACDTVTCQPCNQVLSAFPAPWKVLS